jgi:hypothetical protein
MRKLGFVVALPVLGALIGISPAVAQPTAEVTAFCDAGLRADKAATRFFESERPSKKVRQEFETALAGVESTAPPELATNVQALANEIRTAIQRREEPSQEVIDQNLSVIDQFRYNSCGYRQLEVTGNEYQFQGLPGRLPAGKVAIKFTDTGAEWHELAIGRLKTKDSLTKVLRLSEKEQAKKIEEVGGTFAMQNQTSYTVADLSKPGRYGVVCFLPVGSTSEEAAAEAEKKHAKQHWQEGMQATITVEAV